MMRLTVPTKLEVDGVGEIGGGGGSGVPIATGDSGGIPTEGTTGMVRKRIAIEIRATITRNTTHNRIRSFTAPMNFCWKQLAFQRNTVAAYLSLEPEGQEWLWSCAFEEPARTNAETVLPGRQARCVQRETRL